MKQIRLEQRDFPGGTDGIIKLPFSMDALARGVIAAGNNPDKKPGTFAAQRWKAALRETHGWARSCSAWNHTSETGGRGGVCRATDRAIELAIDRILMQNEGII